MRAARDPHFDRSLCSMTQAGSPFVREAYLNLIR